MRAIGLTAPDTPPAPIELPAPAPRPRTASSCACTRPRSTRSTTRSPPGCCSAWVSSTSYRHPRPRLRRRRRTGRRQRHPLQPRGSGLRLRPAARANPAVHDGAWAELITVPEHISIGPAPDGVDLSTAGAAPLAGITAVTVIDALELSDADVLLVVGATGGVGSLAVQTRRARRRHRHRPRPARGRGIRARPRRQRDRAARRRDRRARARAPPRRRRRATRPRLLRPRRVRRRAQARRPRRLIQRRRRRRPRPHQRDGHTHPREPATPRSAARRRQRCASPCRRPTTSHKRPKRSPRSPAPTPRANSRSRSAEHAARRHLRQRPQGRPAHGSARRSLDRPDATAVTAQPGQHSRSPRPLREYRVSSRIGDGLKPFDDEVDRDRRLEGDLREDARPVLLVGAEQARRSPKRRASRATRPSNTARD